MKLLVTGGCGFIGSNFVRSLNSLNIQVLNIDFMGHGSLDPSKVQNDLDLDQKMNLLTKAIKINNKIRSSYKELDERESIQNVSFDDKI